MKQTQHKSTQKMKCKLCKHEGYPYIKIIRFKNSNGYSVAAYCRNCERYIDNIPKKDIEIKGK